MLITCSSLCWLVCKSGRILNRVWCEWVTVCLSQFHLQSELSCLTHSKIECFSREVLNGILSKLTVLHVKAARTRVVNERRSSSCIDEDGWVWAAQSIDHQSIPAVIDYLYTPHCSLTHYSLQQTNRKWFIAWPHGAALKADGWWGANKGAVRPKRSGRDKGRIEF